MKELTFAQNFALLALNAQDSLHMTVAKMIAMRCMAAAALLEWAMDHHTLRSELSTVSNDDVENLSGQPHQREALRALLKKKESISGNLPSLLLLVKHFSRHTLK